ncbi:MAG: site-2 protease family protein [Dehalococcoidia bacterium]|jgi:Zn-dependent protease
MMKGSLRIARIAGIDIGIHYTWIIIFILICWSLAVGYFPAEYPGWEGIIYWVTAAVAALLLFVSVLVHELAHSLMAISRGVPVKSITLFLLGGLSNLEAEPEKPGIEFAIAIVGPLTSVALAGLFWALDLSGLAVEGPVKATVVYMIEINVLLAAFNILPGFPLDGGRVLRAILWGATNDLRKATNIAATVGQVFGWAMIAWGAFWALTDNIMGGVWLIFIGWFINSAAEASRREMELRAIWLNVKVASVMNDRPETVEGGSNVEALVNDVYVKKGIRSAAVVEGGKLLGIVTLADIQKLAPDAWRATPISKVMTPQPLKTVTPGDNMKTAVRLMAENGLNQLPVVIEERLVGILNRADIIRYVQVHHQLGKK